MKIRSGFVSNSSSSSFIIVKVNEKELFTQGYEGEGDSRDALDISIDEMIAALTAAKEKGDTVFTIIHGGGYDG